MKRSEILKILARRLSNREVDDIYEAAISEMVFVQRAVLEKLPNQPWFLQRESIFPLPVGEEFIQLPEDYNGLMTRGGVWWRPVRMEAAVAATCGLPWTERQDQYALQTLEIAGEEVQAPLIPNDGPTIYPIFTRFEDIDESFGPPSLEETFWIAGDGEGHAVAQTLIEPPYYPYGTIFFYTTADDDGYWTLDSDFNPDKVTIYFKITAWDGARKSNEYFTQAFFKLLYVPSLLYADLVSQEPPTADDFNFEVGYSEWSENPDKMFSVSFDSPGAFNLLLVGSEQYFRLDIHDIQICKGGSPMAWPLKLFVPSIDLPLA